jgi:protein-disulfide isomerase
VLPAVEAVPAPAFAPAQPAAPVKPGAPQVPAESMAGLDFTGLTPAQKDLAVALLNENGCDCSCGMRVAVCRRDDSKCTRSLGLGTQVIALVRQGKARDEIVRTLFNPPSKYVQFAMKPGDSPSFGPAGARVTIVHYTDYQCPFCSKVEPTLARIGREYPKDVRVVFKMHPLPNHPNAPIAAEAALAAAAQGHFFDMHAWLFEHQQTLSRDAIITAAREIGLDVDQFTRELDAHLYREAVEAQTREAVAVGATGTPASFVNGRYVSGAKPFEFYKQIIDEELAWAQAGNRPAFRTGTNVKETAAQAPAAAPAGPETDPNKVYALTAGNAPAFGPAGARVTILHYIDYQCPFCIRVAPTLGRLLAQYPKDVRLVVKMHPLPMHANAMLAAEAALAAQAQGKFGGMHEKLIASGTGLSRERIMQIATELGLDLPRFTKDLDGHVHKAAIEAQSREVEAIGATGTPASFVNGRFIDGAQPYEAFQQKVDEELAKTRP